MNPVNLDIFKPYLEAGQTLLTPGLRLARTITTAWITQQLEAGNTNISEPAVTPVDRWLESEWQRRVEAGQLPVYRLLNRLEERLLWQSVIEQDCEFEQGFKLLLPAAAAERAMQARQLLLQYADDPEALLSRSDFSFDQDCAAFVRWVRAFERRLASEQWLTRYDAYQQLLGLNEPASAAQKPTVVVCFGESLPPLTWRLLAHLANVKQIQDAGPALAQPLVARRFANRRAELASAAAWAAERYRATVGASTGFVDTVPSGGATLGAVTASSIAGKTVVDSAAAAAPAAGTTAIVLLDMTTDRGEIEYFLREQFDCLDARYSKLPVNFSAGIHLAEAPMYRDALLALRVGIEPLSRADLLALLRSPYLLPEGFAESYAGLNLSSALMDLAMDPVDPSDLAHLVATFAPDSPLGVVLSAAREQQRDAARRSIWEWVEIFRQQLATWQWPARLGLDSLEYQQLDKLENTFDQLLSLDEVVGRVDYRQALSLWRSVLADTVFQPKTEAAAVQVLGPLEIVGLSFDAVWVCGAQTGRLPRSPQLSPFIPTALQRELGIPVADADALLTDAKRQIAAWQHNNREVVASCHLVADGVEQLPSALLRITEDQLAGAAPWHRWRDPAELEWVDDTVASFNGELIAYGGGTTVLKNQAGCPFRAWVAHHLGPESVTPTAFGLTAIERGRIAHAALDILWRQLKNRSQLQATDAGNLRLLARDAVAAGIREVEHSLAARKQNLRKRVGSACLDLESERLVELVLDWLALEQARAEDFELSEAENPHALSIGPITLRLRPDRVDRLADGRQLVIDYKTGNVSRSSWLGERPQDPQLPIYALLDAGVEGVAFARLKRDAKGKPGFVWVGEGLGLNPGGRAKDDLASQVAKIGADIASWSDLRNLWRQRLERLAEEYARGEAAIDPQPGACRFCDFASLCRVDSDQIPLSDEEEMEA